MATRRMIDPAFWQSESMVSLTKDQRLLFLGLISNADDQGRLRAHPALINSTVFPFEPEPLDKIQADIDAIAETDSILVYNSNGKTYIQIKNWWTYQKPKWARPSDYPAPEEWIDRVRYRVGNNTIRENWDGETSEEQASRESETEAEPERNHGETTMEPAPKNRGRIRTKKPSVANATGRAPPQNQPSKRKKSKNPPPAAVAVFRSMAHRFPAKSWYADIEAKVGDDSASLKRWGVVVKAWVGMGWNPTNVKGMLDCYERRMIPGAVPGRRDNHRDNLDESIAAVQSVIEEYESSTGDYNGESGRSE